MNSVAADADISRMTFFNYVPAMVAGSSDATTQLHDELEVMVREHADDLADGGPLPLPLANALAA